MKAGCLNGLYGIYIHIPFCIRKCRYCDFYSVTDLSLIPRFIGSVIREIKMSEKAPAPVDTIFFGGGTPSVLGVGHIDDILDTVYHCFDVSADAEITMEVNPGTIDLASLRSFHKAGINRVNIGIQSFNDQILGFLGRIHSAAEGRQAFEAARSARIDNIGLDLIFGIPGQTLARWRQELDAAVGLGPEHLSCYQLAYEPGTQMAADLNVKKFRALPEETAAEMFDQTGCFLATAGYSRYEISNFAVSLSRRSRHNLKYWTFAPYLGFGPSAHSFDGCRRSWNISGIDDYISRIADGLSPTEGEENLDRDRRMTEAVYLGLRLTDGISLTEFNDGFQADFSAIFGPASAAMESRGLLETKNGRCRLTSRGLRFADAIAARLIEAI